jgi:hypothetical protein
MPMTHNGSWLIQAPPVLLSRVPAPQIWPPQTWTALHDSLIHKGRWESCNSVPTNSGLLQRGAAGAAAKANSLPHQAAKKANLYLNRLAPGQSLQRSATGTAPSRTRHQTGAVLMAADLQRQTTSLTTSDTFTRSTAGDRR